LENLLDSQDGESEETKGDEGSEVLWWEILLFGSLLGQDFFLDGHECNLVILDGNSQWLEFGSLLGVSTIAVLFKRTISR